jgi:translocation and assembly module TamB
LNTPDTDTTPAANSPSAAAPTASRRRRWPGALSRIAGGLMLMLAAIAGGGWWTLSTEAGSAWLLTQVSTLVPMVEVREPHGALLGDFSARQVRVKLSDDGSRVVIDALSWRGLKLRPGDAAGLWVHLGFAELRASRVDVLLEPSKTPTASKPPVDVGLPLQLDVDALQLDALHVPGLGDEPLREVRARLQLGAAGGAQHRVEGLQVVWQQLQARASGHIDTRGAMALQIMQLGAIFMLATLLTFGTIALLAGRFGELLQSSPHAQVGLNRLASVVFMGLALRLVLGG